MKRIIRFLVRLSARLLGLPVIAFKMRACERSDSCEIGQTKNSISPVGLDKKTVRQIADDFGVHVHSLMHELIKKGVFIAPDSLVDKATADAISETCVRLKER